MHRSEKLFVPHQRQELGLFAKPHGNRLHKESQYDKYHADNGVRCDEMSGAADCRYNDDEPAKDSTSKRRNIATSHSIPHFTA
jgi:hypothetical protein